MTDEYMKGIRLEAQALNLCVQHSSFILPVDLAATMRSEQHQSTFSLILNFPTFRMRVHPNSLRSNGQV